MPPRVAISIRHWGKLPWNEIGMSAVKCLVTGCVWVQLPGVSLSSCVAWKVSRKFHVLLAGQPWHGGGKMTLQRRGKCRVTRHPSLFRKDPVSTCSPDLILRSSSFHPQKRPGLDNKASGLLGKGLWARPGTGEESQPHHRETEHKSNVDWAGQRRSPPTLAGEEHSWVHGTEAPCGPPSGQRDKGHSYGPKDRMRTSRHGSEASFLSRLCEVLHQRPP